jgi:hypothetical protein
VRLEVRLLYSVVGLTIQSVLGPVAEEMYALGCTVPNETHPDTVGLCLAPHIPDSRRVPLALRLSASPVCLSTLLTHP